MNFFSWLEVGRQRPKSRCLGSMERNSSMRQVGLIGTIFLVKFVISLSLVFVRYEEIAIELYKISESGFNLFMNPKYQGRIDPIEMLRSTQMSGKKAKLKDKYLFFEKDVRLPLSTPTAWLSKETKKQYSIGALWLLLDFQSKDTQKRMDYISRAAELEVETVIVNDRDEIINYFEGHINDSECINNELKLQLASKQTKNSSVVEIEANRKKPELMSHELQVADYLLRFERPVSSKTRQLRCLNKSFEHLLKVLQETPTQKTDVIAQTRLKQIYERKKNPIIIVPQAPFSGNISLSNVERFLLNGQYTEPAAGKELARKIDLEYTLQNKKIEFEVTNNPSLLSLGEWANVICIFVLGHKNEFSSWSIREPSEIFKRAKGFLLRFGTQAGSEVADWNVTTLTLERHARYQDAALQKYIWTQIENILFQKV